MKKFLVFCAIFFLVTLGIKNNLFSPLEEKGKLKYLSKTQGEELLINNGEGFENFKVKGINLENVKPGTFPGDREISEEEFSKWISDIHKMNVNTIRVNDYMPSEFYDAIYKFNEGNKNPIYLIQGIAFDENLLKDGYDIKSDEVRKAFEDNIKYVVDAIHGNKFKRSKKGIFTRYKSNVSSYVIGYTIGDDISNYNIIYSEIMNDNKLFKGKYLESKEDSSVIEEYLAYLGDYLINYESEKFNEQRVVNFVASSNYDLLDDELEKEKFNRFINVENIIKTDNFKSGVVVSYNIYPNAGKSNIVKEKGIDGLMKEFKIFHSIPVLIGEFGASTGRAGAQSIIGGKVLTEKEQGEEIVSIYKEIKKADLVGGCIFEWQDGWYRTSFNTKDRTILDRNAYWKDSETYNQSYGILSFDAGDSYVDNSIEEWNDEKILSESENFYIKGKESEEGITILLKSKDGTSLKGKDIFLDLDTTDNSGSLLSSEYGLKFESPVDFLIKIGDEDSSRILVQEYYNTQRFLDSKEELRFRPDVIEVKKDEDKFSKVMIEVSSKFYNEYTKKFQEGIKKEEGKLILGNGNPNSLEYNSLSDYYLGKDYLEVKIPWGLINFKDPSTRKIHDDYYKNFSIESKLIENIKIGGTIRDKNSSERIKMDYLKLEDFNKINYKERLKKSYYIIQEEFSKE